MTHSFKATRATKNKKYSYTNLSKKEDNICLPNLKKKELFAEIFLTLAYTRHLDFDDTCHIVTWLKVMLDDSMLIENV